jgi:hypothetical protein
MKDRRVDELIRTLPKERASEEFTSRVLDRLKGETVTKRRGRLILGMATAAVLLAVASVGILRWQQAEKAELREEIATLRAEHQALSEELSRVMEQSARVHPVLYLGGDDRTDYVLDMNKLMRERRRRPHIIPLKYTGGPI